MGNIRRIAVNTGGGDAPGLNAVIRAVVLSAIRRGWEIYGIRKGYQGLLKPEGTSMEEFLQDPEGLLRLDSRAVRGITHIGGTILGTSNRGNPFSMPVTQPDGSITLVDYTNRVINNFHNLGFDALIAIGGDGSLSIAQGLFEKGLPVVGVPKTIDNDLLATNVTFGFDTAVSTAVDAIGKLHSTAESHERVMVVELMGRYAGWIALNAGVASTADIILIPEIPFSIDKVCDKIMGRERAGRRFSIVVVAEGATPVGGSFVTVGPKEVGREQRLGGVGRMVADEIEKRTKKETRSLVLGHLQRGGLPTAFDRLIALRFGAAAVRLVQQHEFGSMVALVPPDVKAVSLKEATQRLKTVPLDCDTIQTARDLGICLGD